MRQAPRQPSLIPCCRSLLVPQAARTLHDIRRARLRRAESLGWSGKREHGLWNLVGVATSSRHRQWKASNERVMTDDSLWYKDAVIYQLHVKAFLDSSADGVGDFRGLTLKLDYLQDLGVNILWLLPFYPSPLRDDGYDVGGYTAVHPSYGTIQDFKVFLREA